MALQTDGPISFNDINLELNRVADAELSMTSAIFRTLFEDASGPISMSQGYGKSNWGLHTGSGLTRTISCPNPHATAASFFGSPVAVSGNLGAAASWRTANSSRSDGVAPCVYVYNMTTGALMHTLFSQISGLTTDPVQGLDISGNLMVVSSGQPAVSGVNSNARGTGIAWIFNASTGALMHTLHNPNPARYETRSWNGSISYTSDYFGSSAAIDGNDVAVAAFSDYSNPNPVGSYGRGTVYIFNATTGALRLTLYSPQEDQYFGAKIAMNDGKIAVQSAGKVYLFDLSNGALLHTLTSTAGLMQGGLAISGDNVVCGLRGGHQVPASVKIFSASTGNLLRTIASPYQNKQFSESDNFGLSLDVDEDNLVIGASGAHPNGTSYPNDTGKVYTYNVNTGALVTSISAPSISGQSNHLFSNYLRMDKDKLLIHGNTEASHTTDAVGGNRMYQYTLTN